MHFVNTFVFAISGHPLTRLTLFFPHKFDLYTVFGTSISRHKPWSSGMPSAGSRVDSISYSLVYSSCLVPSRSLVRFFARFFVVTLA